jgi:Ca2+/Na+ antiporter
MFNLLVGLGLAGLAGNTKYEHALEVTSHLQLYIGMIFVLMTLLIGVIYSVNGRFVKSHGICFFTVYGLFLMITCALYA